MIKGRSLELFFVDGTPDGILTAEVFNWTGHVLRFPRLQVAEALKRSESQQTAVYILLGQNGEGDFAYIGEAENAAERLKSHAKDKGWWDQAVIITTAGDALHKAHVKYLESRLVELAKTAGQAVLENGNIPTRSSLNEAATVNMEVFLDTLQMVLPAIKVDILKSGTRKIRDAEEELISPEPQFFFNIVKHSVEAKAVLREGEMVVLAGSIVRPEAGDGRLGPSSYSNLRKKLIHSSVLETFDGKTSFATDYAFSSPSAAAAVVANRSTNGRTSWKTADGKTYAEWEENLLK